MQKLDVETVKELINKNIRYDRNSDQSYSVVYHHRRANITKTNRVVPQYIAFVGRIFLNTSATNLFSNLLYLMNPLITIAIARQEHRDI